MKNLIAHPGGMSVCLLVLCLLLPLGSAQAGGFHYTVSTSTRFYADEAGNLAGVRMNWLYDPAVSAAILDGREASEAGLQKVAEDIMADLFEVGYQAEFTMDDEPMPVKKVTEFNVKLTDERSIQLGFQLPLEQALSVAGKQISLALIDPDGASSMVYASVDRIVLDEVLAAKCTSPALGEEALEINGHPVNVQTVLLRCQ